MTEQTTAAALPVTATQEIVEASFSKELTIIRYQDQLNGLNAYQITSENTAQAAEVLKMCRGIIKKMDDIHDRIKQPYWDMGKKVDAALKSFKEPFEQALRTKTNELQIVLNKIAEENRKKEQERQRIDGIKKAIDNFLLDASQAIAQATTPQELVAIEKLIGSHKANTYRYQEFLPELVGRSVALSDLIKTQKGNIKTLADLEKKKNEALAKDDDRAVEQLQEQQELVQHSINEGKIVVQETAISQALNMDNQVMIPQTQKVKYRRESWKWEVKDIALLFKKMPHLVELTPNKEKIDEYLRNKKTDGSLTGKEEESINGLKLYLERIA